MRYNNVMRFLDGDPRERALGKALQQLGDSVNGVTLGTPTDRTRAQQLDATWCVVTFGLALTDKVVGHELGRAPVGLIQVECPLAFGETLIAGQVLFKSSTSTTVTLQCTGANKKARLLLF